MTDDLTDAVRRLKELQADVERLKAGDDQRGVPRLLFSQSETAVASDTPRVIDADTATDETAVVRDRQTDLRLQRTVETGRYDRTGVTTSTLGFGDELGRLAATASASLRETRPLAAVDATDVNTVGVRFDASFIVGLELIVAVGETTFVSDSFQTDSLNINRRVPEATRVELRSTTTAPGAASVRLGTARPPQLDAESRFDLREPGVVLEVDAEGEESVGVQFESTAPVDVELRAVGDQVGPFTLRSESRVRNLALQRRVAEFHTVRLVTTSVASGTAAGVLGSQ